MKFATASKSELIEEYIIKEILPKYRPGEKIPSEQSLARELQTSQPTLHKIFSNLTAKGILYRENGVGTFISMPSRKNKTITVVVPTVGHMLPSLHDSWFNAQYLLEGFTKAANQYGIMTNLTYLHPDMQPLDEGVEYLLRYDTDVYLFIDLGGNTPLIERLIKEHKICLTRTSGPSTMVHSVYGLIRDGVREAVSYLIQSGRKKIALFGGPQHEYEFERYLGYKDALEDAGMTVCPELVRTCGGFPHEASNETMKMLEEGVRPDAIFGGTDLRSFGIMSALQEYGLKIPYDVAIIGSDNLPGCKDQNPPLASVEYPLHRMGEALFDVYREVCDTPSSGVISRGLECRFIRRESC